jgi:3'5'-cyclic nucleotide phosphodiesterase
VQGYQSRIVLSAPCGLKLDASVRRPPWLAGMWTRAVYDEFFKQGDSEKEMGLDVSPLCDRDTVAIAESQVRLSRF